MTDLKRFEYVLALAECMSFSQAAVKLRISQSTLSQYIQKLEKEIGVSLFDRTTASLSLTQYGELYIKGARKILDSYMEILDSISDADSGAAGCVTVGISPTRAAFMLPDVIESFSMVYPNVVVSVKENKSKDILRDLDAGNIDFAYTVVHGKENMKEYTFVPDCGEEVMLVCKKGSIRTEDGCLDFKSLGNEKFIALQDSQLLSESFNSLCITSDVKPATAFYVSELSTAIALVKKGMGFMLLPSSYKNYGDLSEQLDFFSIRQSSQKRQTGVLYKKDKYLNKPMKALIDIFVKSIQ